MNEIREQVYLAALLHDIGKAFQRADSSGASSSKLLSENIKKLEGVLCPLHPVTKQYSHKHVLMDGAVFRKL